MMIELKNVFITFNKGTAIENSVLKGLSLTVGQGEFVSVIGSNGAGKSTMLNAISGDCSVDSGEILIQGQNVNQSSSWQRANRVARVFQDPMAGTCEDLTIEENMALAYQRGQKRGFSFAIKRQQREIFREKLALLGLGLENRLTDRMGRLSGGQRQAVSLLMASLQPSSILLLDEHTAALDPKTTDFVMQLTDKIVREQKLTTLMVTHSMKQALEYGDRTVMLHQGQVAFDVSGEKRKQMDVPDLLQLFQQNRHEQLADDGLLLGV
ncbi:ABC transporter ATP-binding protein [Haemophilus parahaemolyticus HK385]|nr:ABC transporter ATP-binding protein [Haemophilus parahaemolyticus]STO66185.1 ABC transporter ATP-binding protein [Haemophilus parahaemolyticus HK385]